MDRLADHDAFSRLRTEGRRYRSGPLSVVVRTGADTTRPAIGFAISRRVGNAVTRNRLRRQLREVFRALDASGRLQPGDYLVVVRPEAVGSEFATLRGHVVTLLDAAGGTR